MYKKIISGVLALSLAFGAVALPAAESGFKLFDTAVTASAYEYGDFAYSIVDDDALTIKITKYTGDGGDVVIPSDINGMKIVSIGYGAFKNCKSLTSITIPNSVTSIGDKAFSNCTSLTSITIPNSVTSIGDWAFEYCTSLTSIMIPNSVTSIGDDAFSNCTSLTSITIPNSVTSIGYRAFKNCKSLTSITIPNSVTSIGRETFRNCTSLTSITIPDSVTSIGQEAFRNCASLTSITIPNSVTSIGQDTFNECASLTSVTIPNSVTTITQGAFFNCPSLKSVTIPESVTVVGTNSFGYSGTSSNYVTDERTPDFKIYCYEGSAAERYAKVNVFDYEILHSHKYTEKVTKAATCTTDGVMTYTCECGDTYTETIKATGHTAVTDKAVAATCTTDGKTEGSHCSVCNAVIKAQETVKATGHTFGSWTTTKKATCTATGTQTRTCSVCGKTETKTVAKTAHTYTTTVVKPTTSAKGYTLHKCSACGANYKDNYTAKLTSIAKATVSGLSTKTYTGKAIKPTVTVKLGTKTLKNGTDYTVSYKNNTKTGKATVTIKGKGKYGGTITKYFYIKPKAETISKLTSPKAAQLKVTWKKDTQATGYQITYSTDSKFKKSVKNVTISKNSTVAKTLTKLSKGKKYYVKVRAYKTVGTKKVYGSYSKVKSITVKK